jgi:MFS family permease
MVTQLTGMAGLVGQLAAAVPLVAVLHWAGWSPTFVGMGAVGVLASALAWTGIRDRPAGATHHRISASVTEHLRDALRTPGTWLGFFTHAVGYFPTAVFMLLWGYPFLTQAQGLTPGRAGVVLSVNAVAAVAAGPVVGALTGRHPLRRSWMVVTFAFVAAATWAAVLLRATPSPLWLLVLLVAVLGVGGPVSSIAFDFVRTSNPMGRLGTAIGVANVGGFSFAVLTVQAIGLVLDAVGGDDPLSLDAFRVAFAVQAVPWGVAVIGVLVMRRRARRVLEGQGVVVPPVREVLARRRQERSSGRDAT